MKIFNSNSNVRSELAAKGAFLDILAISRAVTGHEIGSKCPMVTVAPRTTILLWLWFLVSDNESEQILDRSMAYRNNGRTT